jgi:hypothetical protein
MSADAPRAAMPVLDEAKWKEEPEKELLRLIVAVKGSLVLFTGPCQPVNGQLLLLLPALTMVHSSIVFWALWF